jgi:ribose transport system ATP-binding protein
MPPQTPSAPSAAPRPADATLADGSARPGARLSITGANKHFGRTQVLHDVSLQIAPGEIHALVGQNGSGKSTLIKLISGFHRTEPGWSMQVDGRPVAVPVSPSDLQDAGITFVHQDLGLIGAASVVENVRLGRFRAGRITRGITWRHEIEQARAVLDRMGVAHIDVRAMVSSLDHADRASVAIARAIQGHQNGAGVVIFDESTQSLPREYLQHFYGTVRSLADSGTAVLLVSHRLEEVLALCDRVTVLENGRVTVSGAPVAGLDETTLTQMIVGARTIEITAAAAGRPHSAHALDHDGPGFEASDVRGSRLHGIDFAVRPGEVVGVTGLWGSGVEQLPYALAGVRRGTTGSVSVAGVAVDLSTATPATAIDAGLALVPGRRAEEGIALDLTLLENVSLPRLRSRSRWWHLSRRWQRDELEVVFHRLGLVPPIPDLTAGALSGGNQQKLLVGKWLLNQPRVLVLDEPTQAVDVGARHDILQAIRDQAEAGSAVLIVSLEAHDLAAVCDRILIVEQGRIGGELHGPDLDPERILDRVYGSIDHVLATPEGA